MPPTLVGIGNACFPTYLCRHFYAPPCHADSDSDIFNNICSRTLLLRALFFLLAYFFAMLSETWRCCSHWNHVKTYRTSYSYLTTIQDSLNTSITCGEALNEERQLLSGEPSEPSCVASTSKFWDPRSAFRLSSPGDAVRVRMGARAKGNYNNTPYSSS